MGESNNNSLKVSILLPTYNRASLLPKCIDSIINQTYRNWELIIIDDGSLDNTPILANDLQKIDSRIIFHRNQKNVGLPQTRNIALTLASGDLIWFIEDDMIVEIDCLKNLIQTWTQFDERERKLGAICPALVSKERFSDTRRGLLDFARNLQEIELSKKPCIIDKWTGLIYRNFSPSFEEIIEIEDCHSCSLYRRDIFNELKYNSHAYIGNFIGEESDFHFRLRKLGYRLFFQPKAILYHNTIITGGCRLPLIKWFFYFLRNHIVFLKRNFGIRSIYMIPFFFLYTFSLSIRYICEVT